MSSTDRTSGYTDDELNKIYEDHLATLGKTAQQYLDEMGDQTDEWYIPGLVCDSLTIFYGKPEAGKSTLVRNVIAGVTTGSPVLGIETRPGEEPQTVLVLGTEANTRKEYPLKLQAAGADLDRVIVEYAGSGEISRESYELVRLGGVGLVVVDNAQGLSDGGDLNESATVSRISRKIEPFIRAEVPVIMVHHASTAHRNSKNGNRMQGNTQFQALARWSVEVQQLNRDTRRLFAKGNLDTGHTFENLTYDPGTHLLTCEEVQKPRQKRTTETMDRRSRIWEIAPRTAGASQAQVARQIAGQLDITERLVKADLSLGEREGFIVRTPGATPLYSPANGHGVDMP